MSRLWLHISTSKVIRARVHDVDQQKRFMKMTEKSAPTAASRTFQAPAILTGVRATNDNGLALSFRTNELSNEEKVTAMAFHQRFGWILFRENQFAEVDVPDTDAPNDEDKTPSQRLRSVLYILFQQKGKPGENFEAFYRLNLEKAIERVKRLLD